MCVCRLRHAKLFTMLYFMADPAEKHSTGTHTHVYKHAVLLVLIQYTDLRRENNETDECAARKNWTETF